MSSRIKHSGIIEAINDNSVKVKIVQTSACAACKIASHCNTSEQKVKEIDVYDVADTHLYKVGEEVNVSAAYSVVSSALLFGFAFPFVVMIATLIAVYTITSNETVAALSSLVALAPCYLALYLMRAKLSRKLTFTIEKL